jgi:hypothetical protein
MADARHQRLIALSVAAGLRTGDLIPWPVWIAAGYSERQIRAIQRDSRKLGFAGDIPGEPVAGKQ